MHYKRRFLNNFLTHGVCIFILAFFFITVFFTNQLVRWHSSNEVNRKSLLEIRSNLKQGSTIAEVEQIFLKYKTEELRIEKWNNEKILIMKMPPEITSADWQLYIAFENEKVSSILIRSSDGPKPLNSPADIGDICCGFEK